MQAERVQQMMKEKKISVKAMAEALDMDVSTYYRKMQKNGDGFNAVDLLTFKRVLEMNEKTAVDILLS